MIGDMMSNWTVFYISTEVWGAILCVIALVCVLADKNKHKVDKKLRIKIQCACCVLMLADATYTAVCGNSSGWVYAIVRISNYLIFFSNYIYMCLIVIFLWQLIARPGEKMLKRAYAVMSLSLMCVILITVSQFNGMIFYFDENNLYHRGSWYEIIQCAVVAQIIIVFTIYAQYRKRLSRAVSYSIIAFFVMATATTIPVVFGAKLSLQNFAVVMATLLIFAIDYIDISQSLGESQEAYAEADYAARHDSMTGMLNKNAGLREINDYILSMREEDEAALCFVDIDDFKNINDKYGHITGDYWIKEIAHLMYGVCRRTDVLCRFGGDEYLMLIKGVSNPEVIQAKATLLNSQLKEKSEEEGQVVHVSVGTCTMKGKGYTTQAAIESADAALYECKRRGKNTCVVNECKISANT